MNIVADRVKERISGSPGTSSTLTLSAAPTGFRRFSSVMSIGDTCYAVIENGAAWEIGIYTYSAVNTLTRTTVLKSSNNDSLINVGANAFVFISYIADKAVYKDGSNRAVIGAAGIIFSDDTIQTTAASSPEWGNIDGDITDQTDLSNALGLKAPLASPTFTGIPAGPTASGGTNSTQLATTAFVNSAIASASYFTEFLDESDQLEGITPIVPITLDQQPLYFNNLGDIYHSIGWGWSDYGIDGPVMRGFAGFGLGYGSSPAATILVQGDSSGLTLPSFAGTEGILRHDSNGLLGTVTIGSGLSFAGDTLSNTLDLSPYLTSSTAASTYLPLAGGTLTGDLKFTDATYDIGKSGATRPRDQFLSRNLTVGGTSTLGTTTVDSSGLVKFATAATGTPHVGNITSVNAVGFNFGESTIHATYAGAAFFTLQLAATHLLRDSIRFYTVYGGYTPVTVRHGSSPTVDMQKWENSAGTTLSAITATGGLLTNDIVVRNGTTATQLDVNETYTSSTSFGTLRVKANAGAAYQIGSAIGSAGGTNREIQIGHWNSASTFAPALYIGTAGRIGIGTSPANYRWLDITGSEATGNGVQVCITNTSTDGYSAASISFRTGASGVGGTISGFATNFASYGITNGLNFRGATATDNIAFTTGSLLLAGSGTAARLFIAYGGNIGINTQSPASLFDIVQLVSTSGSPTALTITGAAHTTLAASTEATDVNFNLARTVQFSTGALTTQRAMRIQAPTYSFVGASTITTASTLSISGPPVAGTNATITNAYALNVESGNALFSGQAIFNGTGSGLGLAQLQGANWWIYSGGTFQSPLFNCNGWYGMVDGASGGMQFFSGHGIVWSGSGASGTLTRNSLTGDVGLYRDTSGVLAQRFGTNAQTFRVYNTYSSSTSGEWGEFNWATTSNVLRIGTNKGSAGGSARDVAITHGGTVVANFLADRFYLGPIADSTATGGNARGANSVDLIILRTAANQVVSGARSFGAGARCQVSGSDAYVIGNDSWGTGQYSISIGTFCGSSNYAATVIGINGVASGNQSYSLSMGNGGTASALKAFICGEGVSSAQNSWATGFGVLADRQGMAAYAQGYFAANGDAQKIDWILRQKTTDATPVNLFANGSSVRLTIPSGKTMTGFLIIKGIKSDGSAKARFVRLCDITNAGGTTALDTPIEAIGTDYNPSGCTLAVTAENATDDLQVNITGPAGETWRWTATFNGLEIAYGT